MLESQMPKQRGAFALALGHTVSDRCQLDTPRHDLVRSALDDATRWVMGEPVSARHLTDLLMKDDEHGLLLMARPTDDARVRQAWFAFETIVSYVAWLAWAAEEVPADALLAECDATTLDDICLYAVAAGIDPLDLIALRRQIESLHTPEVPHPKDLITNSP